jgi:hypothetical protein
MARVYGVYAPARYLVGIKRNVLFSPLSGLSISAAVSPPPSIEPQQQLSYIFSSRIVLHNNNNNNSTDLHI